MNTRIVQQRYLNHILGQISRHLVNFSNLHKSLQTSGDTHTIDVEIQQGEHTLFHLNNLLLGISIVANVYIILNKRRPYFLILTCYQHGRDSNQLQVLLGDLHLFEIPINEIDCEEQTLCFKFELKVNFDDPVDEDASHSLGDAVLVVHVLRLWLIICFRFDEMLHDILRKFTNILWISGMLIVTGLNSILKMFNASLLKLFSNVDKVVCKLILLFSFFQLLLFLFLLFTQKCFFCFGLCALLILFRFSSTVIDDSHHTARSSSSGAHLHLVLSRAHKGLLVLMTQQFWFLLDVGH